MYAATRQSPVAVITAGVGGIEISVVMPCLNEARTVGRCIEKAFCGLRHLGVHGEVIVADNGSSDRSAQEAIVHGARVVQVPHRGYGSALQAGIAAAGGSYVIMGDADDSYDFTRLEPFVKRLRAGDGLVVGNRFQGAIQTGAMPWLHRYIGNPILSGLLNLFFHTPVHDAHCGLRAIRKEAYQCLRLRTTGMEFASEMVVKACLHGLKVSEVPVVLHRDGRCRSPHLRSFRDGWRHLRFLLLFCPLWLYLIPGTLLLATGLGLMTWLTPGPRTIGGVSLGTVLLGPLCLLLGYQTLWLGACARMFGWTSGLLPQQTFSLRVFGYLNLERGLLAGAGLLLAGLGLTLQLIYEWYASSSGPLEVHVILRHALWGFTAMALGVQTILGSFFLSMLSMIRDDGHPRITAVG